MNIGNIEFEKRSESKSIYSTEYCPESIYFCLFGWQEYDYESRKEDNRYTTEEWDGDGYSTKTYGSVTYYYSSYYARITPTSTVAANKFYDFIKNNKPAVRCEITLSDKEIEIAKARGNYSELLRNNAIENADIRRENEKNKVEYNNTANILLLDAVCEYCKKKIDLPQYDFAKTENYKKCNKAFTKAVKKSNKIMLEELRLEAARTFGGANTNSLKMLPEITFRWLKRCFEKYKKRI